MTATPAALPVRIISADHLPEEAMEDLWQGLLHYQLWARFAFHEIRQRFRRSVLGPFWLTASMGISIAVMGLVFSTLFHQDVQQTLPHIATGIVLWGLLTSCINEGTVVFIGNEAHIRNVPLPLSVHLYRMVARNVIIWGFNMIIYVGLIVVFGIWPTWSLLLFIPAFALFIINVSWIGLAAGILSTRYRDIPQVIINLVQVIFFLTPVFWSVDALPERPAFVALNPLYHLLEIVREPLLGQMATLENWLWSVGMAIAGMLATLWLYRRAYPRIPYWV